ncbi:putative lipoprotein [Escherichia coli]|nr:putative lipoprotein [Escherichia coli]CAD6110947.1 putative lipoprotein [Escherichia coli]CAD6552357.1 putative lipoprotein [Escherichia coli]
MHYRNVVCLLSCLLSCSLFLSSAWGCRLDEPEHNIYQKQGKGVVYLRPYEKTNLSLYRDIIIPLTDESCRNAAAEVQTLKP